jgi:hypothetical protein
MLPPLLLALAVAAGAAPLPDLSSVPEGAFLGARDASRDAALVVAIEDYWKLPDVPGAKLNGLDWAQYLRDGQGVAADRITVLLDGQATAVDIDKAARAMAALARGGRLWVVWIGHGTTSIDGSGGRLVAVDAQSKPESVELNSVGSQALLGAVSVAGPSEVVAVIDACFSGQTTAGPLVPGLQPVRPASFRIPANTFVMTAASADEVAGPLEVAARPAFSYFLLGALRGWGDRNRDGRVTVAEAGDYTRELMLQTVEGRQQTPTVEGLQLDRELSRSLPGEVAPPVASFTSFTAALQRDERLALSRAARLQEASDQWRLLEDRARKLRVDDRREVRDWYQTWRDAAVATVDTQGTHTLLVDPVELESAAQWLRSAARRHRALSPAGVGLGLVTLGAGGAGAYLLADGFGRYQVDCQELLGEVRCDDGSWTSIQRELQVGGALIGLGAVGLLGGGIWVGVAPTGVQVRGNF